MTHEEKRELHIQISQLLADAGLNQGTIKEMVNEEIKNKVTRAVDQVITSLNAQTSGGDYIKSEALRLLRSDYLYSGKLDRAVKEELRDRVIQVVLSDKCEKV